MIDLAREEKEQDGTEWEFGSKSIPCIALIPEDKREQYGIIKVC